MTKEKLDQAYELKRDINNCERFLRDIQNCNSFQCLASLLDLIGRMDIIGDIDKLKSAAIEDIQSRLAKIQSEFDAL